MSFNRDSERSNPIGRRNGNFNADELSRLIGTVVRGKVVRNESYGVFVDFGVGSGLIHISQLVDDPKYYNPNDAHSPFSVGQEIHVLVMDVLVSPTSPRARVNLGYKMVNQRTLEVMERAPLPRQRRRWNPSSTRDMERRAQERINLLRSQSGHWSGEAKVRAQRNLWNVSPSPPKQHVKQQEKRKKAKDEDTASESSESESSSGSSTSESSYERRRRRPRGHGRRSSPRSSSPPRKRTRPSRRSESSSSESSSGSDSESSATTTSSTKSDKNEKPMEPDKPDDTVVAKIDAEDLKDAREMKKAIQGDDDDSSDEEIGPMPLPQSNVAQNANASHGNKAYGGALLPGEGQAIANYVQQNLRIPRRGEIGYAGDDIEKFEKSGYVMSGSRHARMNAVRIRKENQVYSAEEQRALALITMEENQQKEAQLMQDFRTMLKEKQKVRETKKGET